MNVNNKIGVIDEIDLEWLFMVDTNSDSILIEYTRFWVNSFFISYTWLIINFSWIIILF